jgi:hypothetical protein
MFTVFISVHLRIPDSDKQSRLDFIFKGLFLLKNDYCKAYDKKAFDLSMFLSGIFDIL